MVYSLWATQNKRHQRAANLLRAGNKPKAWKSLPSPAHPALGGSNWKRRVRMPGHCALSFLLCRDSGGLSPDGQTCSRDWQLLLWCDGADRGGPPRTRILPAFLRQSHKLSSQRGGRLVLSRWRPAGVDRETAGRRQRREGAVENIPRKEEKMDLCRLPLGQWFTSQRLTDCIPHPALAPK